MTPLVVQASSTKVVGLRQMASKPVRVVEILALTKGLSQDSGSPKQPA